MNVDVDRTSPAAFRAEALVNLLHALADRGLGNLARNRDERASLSTRGVTEAKIALTLSAEQDSGTAIVALGHTKATLRVDCLFSLEAE